MRLFIAIEIPQDVKDALYNSIAELIKTDSQSVKWVLPKLMHLTIKFIGEFPDNKIAMLTEILNEISFSEIKLELKGKGAFPNISAARVLWAGINEPEKGGALSLLVKKIDAALSRIGISPESRLFKPHLTLGRVKGALQEKIKNHFMKNNNDTYGSFMVNSFVLFKSELKPTGPEYYKISGFHSKK